MNILEVGKKYNGPIPQNDGLHFEIGPDGDMNLLIQFRNPDKREKEALSKGFYKYSLYKDTGTITMAYWVFKYTAPLMYMDAPFYAGLYRDERIQKFMETTQNLLQVIILDGEYVQYLRHVGLKWEVVDLFKEIISSQLQSISRSAYDTAIKFLYTLTSKEIFERGRIFSLKEEGLS